MDHQSSLMLARFGRDAKGVLGVEDNFRISHCVSAIRVPSREKATPVGRS